MFTTFYNYCVKALLIITLFQSNVILTIANNYNPDTSQVQKLSDMLDILNIIKPNLSTPSTITLTTNGLANLTILALDGQKNPAASYFINSWSAIANAAGNLQSGQSISFTIDETNNTISSSASTTTEKLLVSSSSYLVIATDTSGNTYTTITTNSFDITLDPTSNSYLTSSIKVPTDSIKQITVYSSNAQGLIPNSQQSVTWLVLPNYISNLTPITGALTSTGTCSISVTESSSPAQATLNYASSTLSISPNYTTNTAYIALVQDSNNEYHFGLLSAKVPLNISTNKAVKPTIILANQGIADLTIVALNGQKNPAASYFTYSFEAISTAVSNLQAGQSVTVNIDESNNTLTNSASTTTDTLNVQGSPYLVIATDTTGKTYTTITTNSFDITFDATSTSYLTPLINVPTNDIEQVTIYSSNVQGILPGSQQSVNWLVLPNYITKVTPITTTLNSAGLCSISVAETASPAQATLNYANTTTTISPNYVAETAYIALVQDSNNQYHFGVFSATTPLNITTATTVQPTITLANQGLANLIIFALDGQPNPCCSYFVNSWSAIASAVANLQAGQSITFTIDEINNKITSSASTTTDTLNVKGSPYLIIATDTSGKIYTTITNTYSFDIIFNDMVTSYLTSSINLPTNAINQATIYSSNVQGTLPGTQQTVDFLALPNYITNLTPITTTLASAGLCSISVSENSSPAQATLNYASSTLALSPNYKPNTDYIALVQDSKNQYHFGLITAENPLSIIAPVSSPGPTISLSTNTILNLLILSLNNQPNPATSYIVNSWNALTTALVNLPLQQSINFTINETNNTISSSASATLTDKLLVSGSPYLIFVMDGNYNSFTAITTNNTFFINVNTVTANPITTTITLPTNTINEFTIFSLYGNGTNPLTTSQTVNWLSQPTYFNNTSPLVKAIVNSLANTNTPSCNISVSEATSTSNPSVVTSASLNLTVNNSTTTAAITPNNTTNLGYLALIQDNTNQYHTAYLTQSNPLLLQLPPQ